ncbi:MAG: diacylglycerol kinase family protein [Gemmatimonadota bacterium]
MAKALLIANPNAARTAAAAVKGIEQVFRTAGWELETLATGGPGDARKLSEYGVSSGVDMVAVFGGDGTTMQAAAALVGTDVTLGVIPGGTGNLLAGNLKLPNNPVKAIDAILRGSVRPLDLGRMERYDGTHYFAVACGAGADARVMTETPSRQKHKWGMMAYFATTLRVLPQVRSVPYEITVDGSVTQLDAAMLLVANCGDIIPPIIRLGQGISPEDGLLDLVVFQSNSVGGSVRAVWDLLRDASGTYGKDVFVGYARGKEISVRTLEGPQPVQLDGEAGGETPFVATVVPGAIRVAHPG